MVEWTPELNDYLANVWLKMTDREIARELTRMLGEPVTPGAIKIQRGRLELTKFDRGPKKFVSKWKRRNKDWQ